MMSNHGDNHKLTHGHKASHNAGYNGGLNHGHNGGAGPRPAAASQAVSSKPEQSEWGRAPQHFSPGS